MTHSHNRFPVRIITADTDATKNKLKMEALYRQLEAALKVTGTDSWEGV